MKTDQQLTTPRIFLLALHLAHVTLANGMTVVHWPQQYIFSKRPEPSYYECVADKDDKYCLRWTSKVDSRLSDGATSNVCSCEKESHSGNYCAYWECRGMAKAEYHKCCKTHGCTACARVGWLNTVHESEECHCAEEASEEGAGYCQEVSCCVSAFSPVNAEAHQSGPQRFPKYNCTAVYDDDDYTRRANGSAFCWEWAGWLEHDPQFKPFNEKWTEDIETCTCSAASATGSYCSAWACEGADDVLDVNHLVFFVFGCSFFATAVVAMCALPFRRVHAVTLFNTALCVQASAAAITLVTLLLHHMRGGTRVTSHQLVVLSSILAMGVLSRRDPDRPAGRTECALGILFGALVVVVMCCFAGAFVLLPTTTLCLVYAVFGNQFIDKLLCRDARAFDSEDDAELAQALLVVDHG